MEFHGELAQVPQLTFGPTTGFQQKIIPRIISPCMPGLPSKKVSNLIDPVQRVWKEQVLDRYFFEFEAAVIKRIPLCQSIQDDILIWPWNPDDVYSVKSEYQLV